jgi:transposase
MRVGRMVEEVQAAWKHMPRGCQRMVRSAAMVASNADFRARAKIVFNLMRGNKPTIIQSVLQCSLSQVYRVAHRFVEQGAVSLADRREDNGEAKISEDYQLELLRLVDEDCPQDHGYRRPTWTQELLCLVMEQRTTVRISASRMCRLLKELQIRLGRPKPIVGCPWKKSRKTRRLRQLQQLNEQLPDDEVLVYLDEVDIHLNPKIGADYMLRGKQKTVLTPGKNEKRYLAGALNAKTGQLTWVEGDRKTSDLFIMALWQLALHDYPKAKCVHVILDNFRIHDSVKARLAVAALKGRVELHFLPPYCPDHNRIERVWKDLHDNVTRNHRCKTLDELMTEVFAYLQTRREALSHEYATFRAV